MASLTLDQAKAVYRQAIDTGARDSEGVEWWTDVHHEVQAVVAAEDLTSAEAIIRWWHHDWSMVGDSARAAARRIRTAAAARKRDLGARSQAGGG